MECMGSHRWIHAYSATASEMPKITPNTLCLVMRCLTMFVTVTKAGFGFLDMCRTSEKCIGLSSGHPSMSPSLTIQLELYQGSLPTPMTPCKVFFPYLTKTSVPQALLYTRVCSQDSESTLVHAKHNGCARHHAEHMRHQSAVQCHHAFFFPDEFDALDDAGVLHLPVGQRCLAKTRSHDLDCSC